MARIVSHERNRASKAAVSRYDIVGLIGLILLVGGIGGGLELMLLAQSQAYQEYIATAGATSPAVLASAMERAYLFAKAGIPIGMLGVMLLAVALRGYLRALLAATAGQRDLM